MSPNLLDNNIITCLSKVLRTSEKGCLVLESQDDNFESLHLINPENIIDLIIYLWKIEENEWTNDKVCKENSWVISCSFL